MAEKFFAKLYPEHEPKQGVITRPDEERRKQIGDRAEPEWFAETEAAVPAQPSRFQKRFDQAPEAGK